VFTSGVKTTEAAAPAWAGAAVIYNIYPTIFSPAGNLNGITAQLPRLKKLGATVLWIMPVTPVGQPYNRHPAFDSPYCVKDYYAIAPEYGNKQDLIKLVGAAHKLGLKIVLDEVLNHSSWQNSLITQHPEFYVHSDNKPSNIASITQAYTYNDVAQFNYANQGVRTYMIQMLLSWMKAYNLDGFRFDSADNPPGPNRTIPASFWKTVGARLRAAKPDVLMIGECESPELDNNPFQIVYGYDIYYRLKEMQTGASAVNVASNWHREMGLSSPPALFMSFGDNWDLLRDVNTFGGPDGAKAVAVLNCTINGVPLIYNGQEIGNSLGGVNPHDKINWSSVAAGYEGFYQKLLSLRRSSPALQQGSLEWLTNSTPSQLVTYKRTGGGSQFIIEINPSNQPVRGRLTVPSGPYWTAIGSNSGWKTVSHADPTLISLPAKGFVIYKLSVSKT